MTMHMREVDSLRAIVDELKEENRQLKEVLLPPENPFYGRFGLTPQLSVILNALFKAHDYVRGTRLDYMMVVHAHANRGDTLVLSEERAKVAICKLRKKLKPYGVKIDTIHSIGFRMPIESKKKLRKIMEKWYEQ